jgi:hypothetical protein
MTKRQAMKAYGNKSNPPAGAGQVQPFFLDEKNFIVSVE